MPTSRLEAFSDGVLAIIITIMVLALPMPDGTGLASLWQSTGTSLLSYLLSFVYVGIYWNNHHHLLHAAEQVTGGSLWANLGLLFWLSLLPFATSWMDESGFARVPVLVYGVVLLLAALAYVLLEAVLARGQSEGSRVRRALGDEATGTFGADRKGVISLGLYAAGILASLLGAVVIPEGVGTVLALGCYVAVALLWLIPDRRLERNA